MADIIAAEKNDAAGTAGINPDVQLMNLNLGFNNSTNNPPEVSTVVSAFRYAINKGAKIINISFIDMMCKYTEEYKPYYAEPISAGLMVVCGAGNEGVPIFYPPQIYPDMTVVGGIRTFARAWWDNFEYGKYFREGNSSYGPQISFMALYDINYKSYYGEYAVASSGTSYCGPQICAIAARIWGNNPGLTRQEVLNIMKECCLPLDPSPYGNEPSGFGYIDCKKLALRYVNIQTKRVNLILKDGKKAVLEMDFVYAKNGGLYKRCTKFLYAYGKKYAINREV